MSQFNESRAQDEVLQIIYDVRQGSKLSQWPIALRAAPEAISIMAVCLSAASHPDAKAIEVGKGNWDDKNRVINFPSQFLDTNLKHCSDLGRRAFREAESGMRKLQLNLEDILGCHGTIRKIVRLLERPEAARHRLRDNMNNLQESADECKKNAEAIKERFDILLSFIQALHKATIDKKNTTTLRTDANLRELAKEENNKAKYKADLEESRKQRETDLGLLEQARKALRDAEEAVDRANAATVNPSRSISPEDFAVVARANNPFPKPQDVGALKEFGRWAFGKSREDKAAETKQEKEWQRAVAEQTKDFLNQNQKHREADQELAMKVLEQAQVVTKTRQQAFEETSKRYRELCDGVLASSKFLETSIRILDNLRSEKLDLENTQRIIEESLESLTIFHHQIDNMLAYFQQNAEYVEAITAPRGNLGKILATVEAISIESGNARGARIIDNIQVESEDKVTYMEHALQLEGRLSHVYQIAGVYLAVSQKYIIPGINLMERMSHIGGSEYKSRKDAFERWCIGAKAEIDMIASKRKEREISRIVDRKMITFAVGTKMMDPQAAFPENDDDE